MVGPFHHADSGQMILKAYPTSPLKAKHVMFDMYMYNNNDNK